MRALYIPCLLALLAWPVPQALAFGPTEETVWTQGGWSSKPLPVPKGWAVSSRSQSLFRVRSARLSGLPEDAAKDGWISEGFDLRRLPGGLPPKASQDALHLAYIKQIAEESAVHTLVGWFGFDDVRASLHLIEGPKGEREIDVVLSHVDADGSVFLMLAFAPADRYAEATSFAGEVFEVLTGQNQLAQRIAALEPTEQRTALPRPYVLESETRSVAWRGREIEIPLDWQVALYPVGQGLAKGLDMKIVASPEIAADDSPGLVYQSTFGGSATPQAILTSVMERSGAALKDHTVLAQSAFGKWACGEQGYSVAGTPVEEALCIMATQNGDLPLLETYSFAAETETYRQMGGLRRTLLMSGELPEDRLSEAGVLDLDPVAALATTRAIAPFPALVPFAEGYRAPAGWRPQIDYRAGAMRFVKPNTAAPHPTLSIQTRFDTGTDAEKAIAAFLEAEKIDGFEIEHTDFLPGGTGLIAVGTGSRNGKSLRIAVLAEADYPMIVSFFAAPEAFDALGGGALLGPVFLGTAPDRFDEDSRTKNRLAIIAEEFGKRLNTRRTEQAALDQWQQRTEAESVIHGYRMLSQSLACGGWCY